jgi:hypothetical protein
MLQLHINIDLRMKIIVIHLFLIYRGEHLVKGNGVTDPKRFLVRELVLTSF